MFCCATLGSTSSGAFDPIRSLGEICRTHQVWMHVDAAWAGSAFICPEYQHYMDGIELAQSFDFNPHKWYVLEQGAVYRVPGRALWSSGVTPVGKHTCR